MSLDIRLNAALKKPLYQQLVEAIVDRIEEGAFEDGERLPSVRDLALAVRINPNTVARAYQELENKALVVSHRGKGVFIRLPPVSAEDFPAEISDAIDGLIETAQALAFPLEPIERELRRRFTVPSALEK